MVRLFIYNHPKNFETAGKNCTVDVGFEGLPPSLVMDGGNSSKEGFASAAVAVVRHARIDVGHANPVANWTAMGRPTYPTPEELAKLETASELAWVKGGSGTTYAVPPNGMVVVDVSVSVDMLYM